MITLVLGGARSGKSEIAEGLVAKLPAPILYFATAQPEGDDDFIARVERHRDRRPSEWTTIEAGADLAGALQAARGTALVDALGPWVSSHADFVVDVDALIAALTQRDGDAVVVSEEVGLGVHPSTESGRKFRDALGDVNRAVAAIANEVLLVVAGRVLPL
ncbi:MAG: adenosylcobinamide kinase / adenosylcobinamide-phosphate guanylyltransferase [Acidimicrobiaceae bacterium]